MPRVRVIAPDGKAGSVDDSELTQAQEMGYRVESAGDVKRRDAEGQQLRTAGEGAARALTLGLSDPFLKGFTGDEEGMRTRREVNPGAAVAGEVAGTIGGMFIPGSGPAVAAKAGAGVSAAAQAAGASNTVARLAGGAVEGGLWGLGNVITESTIGDPKLTGEQLGVSVLGGALVGAGANAVTGAVQDLGASALNKAFGGAELKKMLREKAEQLAVRAVAKPGDFNKRNLANRAQEVGRAALDEGLVDEGLKRGAGAAASAGADVGQQKWAVVDDALKSLDDGLKVEFDPYKAAGRVTTEVLDKLQGIPSAEGTVDRLREVAANWVVPGREVKSFRKAFEEAENILEQVGENDPKLFKKQLFKLRKALQDEIFDQAEAAGVPQLRAANKEYANVASFRDLAKKSYNRQQQNRGFSLTDDMAMIGGMIGAGPEGLLLGPIHKIVRERGGFASAAALDKLASSKAVERIADGFHKFVKDKLSNPAAFGAFRQILENASAQGAMDLLGTHVNLASSNPEYMAAMGMVPENADTLPSYADKAERLARLANVVDGEKTAYGETLDKFFGVSSAPGRPSAKKEVAITPEDLKAQIERLRQIVTNGAEMSKKLSEIAPDTSALASLTAARGAEFLLSKAPKDPTEGLPPALKEPWQPTAAELQLFATYVRAVAHPEEALHDLVRNDLQPETLEAISNVYPRMYQEFRDKMRERLESATNPLSYKQRQSLAVFMPELFSSPSDSLIQELHRRSMGGDNKSKPVDGRQKVSQENNIETQAQRLENRSAK